MDYKVFAIIFITVFIAELGDKIQLATFLFASDKEVRKMTVFIGVSLALVTASAVGVLAGSLFSQYINEQYLNWVAGFGFVVIGLWTLFK